MKISLIAAIPENGVIGSNNEIPWHAKGEQALFKGITQNSWSIVGRKTYETMSHIKGRQFAPRYHQKANKT